MSPEFLKILYLGLAADFRNHVDQLLIGIPIDMDAFAVIDNHTNNSPGYVMRAATNSTDMRLVGEHEWRNGLIRRQFINENGSINETEAKSYVSLFDKSCRILFALIHLSSGMSARATEINEQRLCNGTSLRNIFFVDGRIMIITRYNKVNTVRGENTVILRFLPVDISKVVALWIIIIRPFYSVLIGRLIGNDRRETALKYCYVKEGECFEDTDVRTCFEEATLKYPGKKGIFKLLMILTEQAKTVEPVELIHAKMTVLRISSLGTRARIPSS